MAKQLAGRCRNGHQMNAVEDSEGEFYCPECGAEQIQFSLVTVPDQLAEEVSTGLTV